MKCQKCGKNTATTHITQVINGNKTEMYLCGPCAEESQDLFPFKHGTDQEFENLFKGFWGVPTLSGKASSQGAKKCNVCGTTERELLRYGKPGCSKCYTAFSDYFLRPLKEIHGSTKHSGKIPSRSGKGMKTEMEIEGLQSKLNEAVINQNFEDAAVLRDKIKLLKAQHEKGDN